MNILEALGVATREDVITNMLAYALNNSERFRAHLLNKISPGLDSPDITWEAHPRVGLAGIGAPDLVLVGKQRESGFLIVIENKLTADEGNDQTRRYASPDSIKALTRLFLPGITKIQSYFLFLTLFPDTVAEAKEFTPLTHRDLFRDFTIVNSDQLQERLIADWKSIISEFYKRENLCEQANISEMLRDDRGLDGGYLYFRKVMKQIPLPNALWLDEYWRDSRQGRKYYGAKFSKGGWQTNELYKRDTKWQFDNTNHDIHLEPQYNVLNEVLSIFLHYEINPYKTERWSRANIPQEYLTRYLEDRRKFTELLSHKDVPGLTVCGGWNQIAKLTVDFGPLTTRQAMDVLVRAFDTISAAVDDVLQELGREPAHHWKTAGIEKKAQEPCP